MKTYNFTKRGIALGVPTAGDAAGPHVLLGEIGRGRFPNFLRVERTSPPVVDDDKIVDADFKRGRFVAPEEKTNAVLVRASADGAYTRGRDGSSFAWLGQPESLATGRGADGDAGRIGSWTDTLWRLEPGDAILVWFGDGKYQPVIVWHRDGAPQAFTREQAESLAYDDVVAGRMPVTVLEDAAKAAAAAGKTGTAGRLAKLAETAARFLAETRI